MPKLVVGAPRAWCLRGKKQKRIKYKVLTVRIECSGSNLEARAVSPNIGALGRQLPLEGPQQLEVTHRGHPDTPPQIFVELLPDVFN